MEEVERSIPRLVCRCGPASCVLLSRGLLAPRGLEPPGCASALSVASASDGTANTPESCKAKQGMCG